MNDFRFAFRQLFKSPAFTIVAVVTLGLGIAASTAIFSVVDAVLLHPLPYPHSEQIVTVSQTVRSTGVSYAGCFTGQLHRLVGAELGLLRHGLRTLLGAQSFRRRAAGKRARHDGLGAVF